MTNPAGRTRHTEIMKKIKTLKTYLKWLLPDAVDSTVYLIIIWLSFILSNITNLQRLSEYSGDLDIRGRSLNFLDSFLVQLLGEQVASALVNGIFWALVGLVTYLLVVVIGKFFSEVGEDLEISQYKHPTGADRFSRLKHFTFVCLERIAAVVVLVLFLKFTAHLFFNQWIKVYEDFVSAWPPNQTELIGLAGAVVAHFLALHGIVIVVRLILLRRRAFGL